MTRPVRALPVPNYAAESDKDVKGLKIGIPEEYFG
jgi:Asp-tRNA(Asn)/Glu-tRNA(Gln) amidotransferase A subunit family amidase